VAGLASLSKAAVVRIAVTVSALVERDAGVARLAVLAGSMALGASDRGVQSGQRIPRLAVIELTDIDGFPVFHIMALLTGLTQPSIVWVLVTRRACRREAKVGASHVFDLDGCALRGSNAHGRVATVALQPGVFAYQRVSCLFVIERFGVPLDKGKIFAVMIGVATRALFAGSGLNVVRSVQASACHYSAGNLRMAVHAAKGGCSAQLVAGGAVGCSVEKLVRTGQRPRRNLPLCAEAKQQKEKDGKDKTREPAPARSRYVVPGTKPARSVVISLFYRRVTLHRRPQPATCRNHALLARQQMLASLEPIGRNS